MATRDEGQDEQEAYFETFAESRHEAPIALEVGGGTALVYSRPFWEDKTNEDGALIAVSAGQLLLAVADGVGGLPRGHEAARAALDALGKEFVAGGRVEDGLEYANQAVNALRGPAATVVAALIVDGSLTTFHAGDSQALVIGGRGKIKAETMPHTVVGHGTEAGLLEKEEAASHPERHVVTNALGEKVLRTERSAWGPLAARDTVLLASDGLFDNLTVPELGRLAGGRSLHAVMQALLEHAQEAMGSGREGTKPDDLTIVLWRRASQPRRRDAAGRVKPSRGA